MVPIRAPGLAGAFRTMATLKCLACGYDNKVGDESCSSCSSSLNLKLCSVCEAINANNAERCHSCNVEFRVEREVADLLEADALLREGATPEASPVVKTLPAVWRMAADRARKGSTKLGAALWVLPLLAAGLGYYFYVVLQAPQSPEVAGKPEVAQKVEAAQKSEPAANPELAPKELAKPQSADLKPAPAPAVSGRITPPKTAPAPIARSTPTSEPKRTTASVTHTRAAAADASTKTAVAALPAATPVPAAASAATVAPASEPPSPAPDRRRVSVTHTKAVLTEAAAAVAAPAAATEGRTVPVATKSDEPAGCAAAVVALGLCKSK